MKKYRLKDHELQEKLEALDPEFSETFSFKAKLAFTDPENKDHLFDVIVNFGAIAQNTLCSQFRFVCSSRDIESYEVYDPNKWNNFPEITPPFDVMMRVELSNGEGSKAYFHNFFESGSWCYGNGMIIPKSLANDIKRFRPWE